MHACNEGIIRGCKLILDWDDAMEIPYRCYDLSYRDVERCAGKPLEGDQLQAEVASLIVGGLDTTAQTCSFTLCGIST